MEKHLLPRQFFHLCGRLYFCRFVDAKFFLLLGNGRGVRSGRNNAQGPVSRKSRNFTGHFRVSQFPLYLKNGEDLSCQASQLFFFLLSLKHVKRPAFQNKRLAVSQMAFRDFRKIVPRSSSPGFSCGNCCRQSKSPSYGYLSWF